MSSPCSKRSRSRSGSRKRRQSKLLRDNDLMASYNHGPLKRMGKSVGVDRISKGSYDVILGEAQNLLKKVVHGAVKLVLANGRTTVRQEDVIAALINLNQDLIRPINDETVIKRVKPNPNYPSRMDGDYFLSKTAFKTAVIQVSKFQPTKMRWAENTINYLLLYIESKLSTILKLSYDAARHADRWTVQAVDGEFVIRNNCG